MIIVCLRLSSAPLFRNQPIRISQMPLMRLTKSIKKAPNPIMAYAIILLIMVADLVAGTRSFL